MTSANWQQNFTATGGPMPDFQEPSVWARTSLWGLQAPIHPPFRFTDESVILVVILLREPDIANERKKGLNKTFIERVIKKMTGASPPSTRIARMPRSEYLKHFVHYEDGGSKRTWSEKELELEFEEYQDSPRKKWVRREVDGRVFMEEM
ncbi:hypothetical protein G7Y89_g15038 [Cudoniella acicularis]|uniref:Uncharacterized protein n=1 Tax=Cudoniella acicularis TaxID=354080 RepID=A0A8H4QW54_9HELO|nr:hypothetical protein G7Y89_g15038 [Cudoniella acicularis]